MRMPISSWKMPAVHQPVAALMLILQLPQVSALALLTDILGTQSLALNASGRGTSIIGPEQIISWKGDKLEVGKMRSLMNVRGDVGTVCVTGDDRIGKSTLLTLWGRNISGSSNFFFSAGHNRSTHTQGIWSAVIPTELSGLSYQLNLCDSQGLKKVDERQHWRLFSANVLVPSVLVYMVIDVVQNDKLRDLASMAIQFEMLSKDEDRRFKQSLSPHLVVVVREESDLDGDGGVQAERNLSAHLEEALSGEGFKGEKDLIKRVFQTREAWSLNELPKASRKFFRDSAAAGNLDIEGAGEDAMPWRRSGEMILRHVLHALESRSTAFHCGGPDLAEWYRSVIQTVNSEDSGSMGRLIASRELDLQAHEIQALLQKSRKPLHMVFAGLASLLGFGGILGRWLDRIAWAVWVVLCVIYVGTSPLVTTPLGGFVPQMCEVAAENAGVVFLGVGALCRQASTQTASLLLAALVGILSYPLLTGHILWFLTRLPLPESLKRSGPTLLLTVAFALLGMLGDIDIGQPDADTWCSWSCRMVLTSMSMLTVFEFGRTAQSNYYRSRKSAQGRSYHDCISGRVEEVRALEATQAWRDYFSHNRKQNSLWRYRTNPAWWEMPVLLQALGLLAWSYIIRPHCDAALAMGSGGNFLYLLFRFSRAAIHALQKRLRPEDDVEAWFNSLEDASAADEQWFDDSSSPADVPVTILQPESEIERGRRLSIEQERCDQEPPSGLSCGKLLRLCSYLVVLGAIAVGLLGKGGIL